MSIATSGNTRSDATSLSASGTITLSEFLIEWSVKTFGVQSTCSPQQSAADESGCTQWPGSTTIDISPLSTAMSPFPSANASNNSHVSCGSIVVPPVITTGLNASTSWQSPIRPSVVPTTFTGNGVDRHVFQFQFLVYFWLLWIGLFTTRTNTLF